MPIFRKGPDPNALVLAMTGVQMGDRLLQVGCADRALIAALAAKVGLSGQTTVAAFDQADAERARKTASQAGALVEVATVRPSDLRVNEDSFDLVVIDGTAGLLASLRPEDRVACLQQSFRALRPAGRVVVVESAERGGLGSLLSRSSEDPHYRASGGAVASLEAEGFRSVRVLAERDGRRFTEGLKPRRSEA